MNYSRISQDNRISASDWGQVGLETIEVPLKPRERPEDSTRETKSQPPIQPVAERFPALEEQEVMLTLLAPKAAEVKVAGSFNGWRPDATPLRNTGDGKWLVRLMLRSGQYEYRFVVDGQWSEDPQAAQRVANSYGDFNSVLRVPLTDRDSLL